MHTGAPGRNKTSQLMSFCSLLDSLALVVVYFAHHGVQKCSWIIRSIIAVVNILLRHGPIQGLSFRCLTPLNPPRISCRDTARWHPRFYTCSSNEDISNIKSRGIETNTTICLPVICLPVICLPVICLPVICLPVILIRFSPILPLKCVMMAL